MRGRRQIEKPKANVQRKNEPLINPSVRSKQSIQKKPKVTAPKDISMEVAFNAFIPNTLNAPVHKK